MADSTENVGKNIIAEVKGKTLILTIDLDGDQGLSSSGKSLIIATSSGNADIAGVKVGLNVYRKPSPK